MDNDQSNESNAKGEAALPETAPDLAALAPDPPEVNARALAAETGGAMPDGFAASIASRPAFADGVELTAPDGRPLRRVANQWFDGQSGRELRDRYGSTFDERLHVMIGGVPKLTKAGALCLRSGTAIGKASQERARVLSGLDQPIMQGSTLPPSRSTVADVRPPMPSNSPTNQTLTQQATTGKNPDASPDPMRYGPAPGHGPLTPTLVGPGSPANDAQAKALAETLVATLVGGAVIFLGPHAAATRDERTAMQGAWEAYLRTVDCSYVPPWAVPILATVPWATRVVMAPETTAVLAAAKPRRTDDDAPTTVSDAESRGGEAGPEAVALSLDDVTGGLD